MELPWTVKYRVPSNLRAHWLEPIVRAGHLVRMPSSRELIRMTGKNAQKTVENDIVQDLELAAITKIEPTQEGQSELHLSPIIVEDFEPLFLDLRKKKGIVAISMQNNSEGPQGNSQCWRASLAGDWRLLQGILLILIASGMRPTVGITGCQKMFQCPKELKDRWWQHLKLPEARTLLEMDTVLEDYPNYDGLTRGHIVNSNSTIEIFAGPSLNPETGCDEHFLALDYRTKWLRKSSTLRLLEGIERILLEKGCTPIDIEIFPT